MKKPITFVSILALGVLLFAAPSWRAIAKTVSVSIGDAAVTSNSVSWPVKYTDAKRITLAKRDVTIAKTGTADYGRLRILDTTPTVRTIKLAQVTGDGTFTAQIAPGSARDAAGNKAPGAGPSQPVTIDTTPPTVEISAPDPALTATGPVVFIVTYSGADTITLKPEDIAINGEYTGDITVEVISPTQRKVTITNIRKKVVPA